MSNSKKKLILISVATLLGISSFANAKSMCHRILSNNDLRSKGHGSIFYETAAGLEFLGADKNKAIKGIKGRHVYFLQKEVKGVGGVLVVKAGRPLLRTGQNDNRVEIKPEFYDREITKCAANSGLRERYKRLKKQLRTAGSRIITFEMYQTYARGNASAINKKVPKKVQKILNDFHFSYRDRKNLNNCNVQTNNIKNGNRVQSSLEIRDTGATTRTANLFRLISGASIFNSATADPNFGWTVRMIPYDYPQNYNSSVACIKIKLPNLSRIQVLRINDLRETTIRQHRKDREWKFKQE